MDLSESIIAKSDQQNAADYLSGPRTFTIESVSPGSREQPVNVHLVEAPGKPYRPSKTMRRVLVALWGKDSTQYAGRRITLYCDPSVMYGGAAVGGIKISHMSHLEKRRVLVLTATQKTKAEHIVQPLVEAVQQPTPVPGITAEQWTALHEAATVAGIENTGAFVAETLGRQLTGWQEITPTEYETIMAGINTPPAES